mgnify:CR=1 FL=1
MAKKKRTYKGVRYIAKSLTKYFKKKYPSYALALPRAREIHKDLKEKRKKVILKNIFPYERTPRGAKKPVGDLLPKSLTGASHYFNLVDYPNIIGREVPNKVWFESSLFPIGLPPIQGGTIPDYHAYFAPFVNYINSIAQNDDSNSVYATEWMVRCTDPIKDSKGRYMSQIISCMGEVGDPNATPFDYGFNPKSPDVTSDQLIISGKTVDKPIDTGVDKDIPTDKTTQQDIAFIQAQKELESATAERELATEKRLKAENIATALKMYNEGKITEAQFNAIIGV